MTYDGRRPEPPYPTPEEIEADVAARLAFADAAEGLLERFVAVPPLSDKRGRQEHVDIWNEARALLATLATPPSAERTQ